jgi:hypothetical protein
MGIHAATIGPGWPVRKGETNRTGGLIPPSKPERMMGPAISFAERCAVEVRLTGTLRIWRLGE